MFEKVDAHRHGRRQGTAKQVPVGGIGRMCAQWEEERGTPTSVMNDRKTKTVMTKVV